MNLKKWRRLLQLTTLKRQLTFWMVSLFFATGAVIITALIVVSDYGRRDEVVQQLEETMKTQQFFIDNWLVKRKESIDYLSTMPAVKMKDYDEMELSMQAFINSQKEFTAVIFANKDGITQIDTTNPAGIDLSDRDYFQAAKKGETVITDVIVSRATKKPLIILSAPAYDLQGNFHGVLFGAITLTTINDLLNGLNFGKTGETYLVNQEGKMLTQPRSMKATADEDFYKDAPILSNHIYEHIQSSDNHTHSHSYKNYLGEEVLGSHQKITRQNWHIIGEIKKEEVLLPFWKLVIAVVLTLLAALLIFYGILLVMTREIYLPLSRLLEGTKKMAERNFTDRIEEGVIQGSATEFQELCHSYNQMAATIEKYTKQIVESEDRYKVLIQAAPEAIGVHREDRILFINEQTVSILKAKHSNDIVGRSIQEFIHPESLQIFNETRKKNLNYTLELKLLRIDHTVVTVQASVGQIMYKGEPATQFILHDVTEYRQMQDELRQSQERYLAVINQTKEVIFQLNLKGQFIFLNYYWKELTGHTVDESLGCSVFDYLAEEDRTIAIQNFEQLLSEKILECREEFQLFHKTGDKKWIEVTASLHYGTDGEIVSISGVMYDMTERKKAEQQLKKANEILSNLSMIDGLTEIPNRRAFDQRVKEEWSRSARTSQTIALIMLDIDHFKIYNDTYGHQGGDECLKQVAKAIQSSLKRPGDLAARYGGEEFAVILPNTDRDGACLVAEAIRSNIEKLAIPHIHSRVRPYVTISAGVSSMIATPYLSMGDLLRLADQALYHSKETGRNKWHYKGREHREETEIKVVNN